MANNMTSEEKKKILTNINTLDYLEGTGVLSTNRKHLADEIFVFISAGGTGYKALTQLKKTLYKQVEHSEIENQVMFLAIDTAHKELDELVDAGVLTESEIIKVPYRGAHDSIAPGQMNAEYKPWVNPKLWAVTGGTNTESKEFNGTGAGGRRQCGRVLFCQQGVHNILQMRLQRVNTLLAQAGFMHGKVKVFFFSGIAGGTGSGCTVDLAYLTRHYMKGIMQANASNVEYSAYLFMPSASGADKPLSEKEAASGNRNAYAALKEIDYFMSIAERKETFHMDYGNQSIVDLGDNIFNICTLVEGVGDGVQFLQKADTARQIVADSIINIICKDWDNIEHVNGSEKKFLVDSFFSNQVQHVTEQIRVKSDKMWPRDTNYIYSVIGFSSCIVPIDLLTLYVAKKVFDEVFARFQRAGLADETAAKDFLTKCKLDNRSLESNWNHLTRNRVLDNIKEAADNEFKIYGPYYMVNLADESVIILRGDRERAEIKSNGFMANKEKWARIIQCYDAAIAYIREINQRTYNVYTEVVEVLKELLEKNAKILTSTKEYQSVFGKSFNWSPIDLTPGGTELEKQRKDAVYGYLDSVLSDNQVKKLAVKFVEQLCDKKDEWTGLNAEPGTVMPKFNAAHAIREFIEENLKTSINTTLEEFVVKAYTGNRDAAVCEEDERGRLVCSKYTKQAAQNIYNSLITRSSALVSPRNNFSLSDTYSNVYLTIPSNCSYLYQAMEQIVQANGTGNGTTVELYKTSGIDRIVLCQLYAGVPAWALYWTSGAEAVYEGPVGTTPDDEVGLHIEQGSEGRNWAELPNLYPQKLWTDPEKKLREREANISEAVYADMKKAREVQCLKVNGNTYSLILPVDKISAEQMLEEASLDPRKKYSIEEALGILLEKGILAEKDIEYVNQDKTPGEHLNDNALDEFGFEMACRTLRRLNDLRKELAESIDVLSKLKELVEARVVADSSMLMTFINAVKWEILRYDGRKESWFVSLKDEKRICRLGNRLEKICAHYYGYKAFIALEPEIVEQINEAVDAVRDTASDEVYDQVNDAYAELRDSLDKLRYAKKNTVCPWKNDSPFKDANNAPWPMATDDFEERMGSTEAKAIRDFYTELIDNM